MLTKTGKSIFLSKPNKAVKAVPIMLLILGVLVICTLTGCAGTSSENIKEAFMQIEDLQYEEALQTLETARLIGEDERLVYRGMGIANLGLGNYETAVENFETALKASDGVVSDMDFDLNFYLATAYFKMGKKEESAKIYDNILAIEPENKDALYLRGVIYAQEDNLDKAMESFDAAISIAPEDYDMLINIYCILADKGYKDVGQNYLRVAMETGTKKMSNYEKGQISFYMEDYESARTYLEKAKDEEGYEAVLFLGKTYETLGDVNYAISVYSGYITSGKESPEVLNQMGLCKLKMEDYEGALLAFQQAMNIEGNGMMQTLRFNEIVAYEYIGDFKKACVLMESYLASYPDDEDAKREYEFLKTR